MERPPLTGEQLGTTHASSMTTREVFSLVFTLGSMIAVAANKEKPEIDGPEFLKACDQGINRADILLGKLAGRER